MKAKFPLFSLAVFFFLTISSSVFGQITGPNTQFYLSRYNFVPGVGKSPVVLGDTLGIMGFRGLLSSGDYQRSAGIYALVTSAPTTTGLATRLTFATGANGLQDRMTILENGFVGINTNAPAYHLDVNGDVRITGNFIVDGNFSVAGSIMAGLDLIAGRDVKAGRNVVATENVSGKNLVATQDVTASGAITATGNITTALGTISGNNLNATTDLSVGNRVTIGAVNTPAGYRLYVADGILAEKVKVAVKTTANWADYVFNPNYQLSPLKEVQQFIQENGHLPGIPSAQEVVKNGINVAEMDAKLLEKIEELTLHLIALEKRMQQVEAENLLLKLIQK